MPTKIYKIPWLRRNQEWTAELDWKRMQILENQMLGSYFFLGQGVISGWHIVSWNDFSESNETIIEEYGLTYITQEEVDQLSSKIKSELNHLDYKMIIKVTQGEGNIGFWPAYTTSDFWYALPKRYQNDTWYVYAVPTENIAEPEMYEATILISDILNQYDKEYPSVYLGEIRVIYNPIDKTHFIYKIIVEDGRRKNLANMEGSNFDSILREFIRHRHDGKEDSPTQILMTTDEAKNTSTLLNNIESPIFKLENQINLTTSLAYGPDIISIEDYGNGNLDDGLWRYAITFNVQTGNQYQLQESLPGQIEGIIIDDNRSIKITWNRMPGAESYNVYRTETSNDGIGQLYKLKSELNKFEFIDKGLDDFILDSADNKIEMPKEAAETILSLDGIQSNTKTLYLSNEEIIEYNPKTASNYVKNFAIPGIGIENNNFGKIKNTNVIESLKYYKADVWLNGKMLSPNDYQLLINDSQLNTTSVFLKNNLDNNNILQVITYLYPHQTQVTNYILEDRLAWINGEALGYGRINKKHIMPPDHYGLQKLYSPTYLKPYNDMRTSNYTRYFLQDHNSAIQYDDDILLIYESQNISNKYIYPGTPKNIPSEIGKYVVTTKHSNLVTSNFQYFEKILDLPADLGLIIKCIDNTIEGDAGNGNYSNHYVETFVLLNTGRIFYTTDNFGTFEELPIYPSNNFFATAFEITTKREEFLKEDSSYQPNGRDIVEEGEYIALYSRILYIGGMNEKGENGLWEATIGPNGTMVDINWQLWPEFNNFNPLIYDIREMVTEKITWTETLGGIIYKHSFDRTVYVATSQGFFVNHERKFPDLIVKKIHWLHNNHILDQNELSLLPISRREGSKNGLLLEIMDSNDPNSYQYTIIL